MYTYAVNLCKFLLLLQGDTELAFFISLTYTIEVGKPSPKHQRTVSKESSKINMMVTELVVNYQNRNPMEVNKLDSIQPRDQVS